MINRIEENFPHSKSRRWSEYIQTDWPQNPLKKPLLFEEAQLFYQKNRATLTFYHHGEVISIHFDRKRQEIFYKGHNIKNMVLEANQKNSLYKFSKYLQEEGIPESFRSDYEACLNQIPLQS